MGKQIPLATKLEAIEALKTETYAVVAERFKVGNTALARWRSEHAAGTLAKDRRTQPDEKKRAAVAALKTETYEAVCERFDIGTSTLKRWRHQMAPKRGRQVKLKHLPLETKIAAVAALVSGVNYKEVMKRFGVRSNALLYVWRKKYANRLPAKEKAAAPAERTPERVFDDRVREAIALLRRADKEVERMKREGKLKEADAAHLYAQLALRMLQGDNGT